MAAVDMPECLDFLHFQEILKRMRTTDDKIIYIMNDLPTESFTNEKDCKATCKEIYKQLRSNHTEREKTIRNCLDYTTLKVQELKAKRENDIDNENILKKLRKEQGKLKLLQMELGVEEVVRDRTYKIYYERCRQFYMPPDVFL